MGLRVNTNVTSINAQRNLFQVNQRLSKNYNHLSTGLRIASAADDSAGLAISERLRAQIRSLSQAERNANDAVSLVQTGEGALNEVNNILVRMRELAVQASNGTVSATDKETLQTEFAALRSEITRISQSTEFNGIKLLDGSAAAVGIQVGIDTNTYDSIAVDVTTNRNAASLGLATGIDTAVNATGAMAEVLAAIDTVSSARSDFGAIQNRLEVSIRNINNQTENLSAANSRIRDVDVAKETSTMTSYQILQQAGVSMLAQANMTTGLAMTLLS